MLFFVDGDYQPPEELHELHNTSETGLPGIWWVEASFIDELRP